MNTGVVKDEPKKKVRFADDVAKSSTAKNHDQATPRNNNDDKFQSIPQNWQVLYKGILQRRRV